MSAATIQKAERLRRDGRVSEITTARVFEVRGDHATYRVIFHPDGSAPPTCDCQARGECSHLHAVNGELLAERPAIRHLDEPEGSA